jgi:hypothetical protein
MSIIVLEDGEIVIDYYLDSIYTRGYFEYELTPVAPAVVDVEGRARELIAEWTAKKYQRVVVNGTTGEVSPTRICSFAHGEWHNRDRYYNTGSPDALAAVTAWLGKQDKEELNHA